MMGEQPVAVVSGASGGIGSAVVKRLLHEGYAVMALARDKERLHTLQGQLGSPSAFSWYAVDVTDWGAVSRTMGHTVDTCEGLDLVVTCHAAPPAIEASESLSWRAFERVWRTDALGTFNVCQEFGRAMLKMHGGCIVNLSSMHALASYPMRSAYAAAKSAVIGFSRVLAIEWAGRGVRVNCIAPAQVEGPRTFHLAENADVEIIRKEHGQEWSREELRMSYGNRLGTETLEHMRQRVPNRQLVQPEDVAETVLWLAKTPSVNGQTIILDHGLLASAWYEPYLERA